MIQNKKINTDNVEHIKMCISKETVEDALKKYFCSKYPVEDVIYALECFDFSIKCKKKEKIRHEIIELGGNRLKLDESILLAGGKQSSLYLRKVVTQDYYHLSANTTVAKLNKNGKIYWANPPIEYVNGRWILILNNIPQRSLLVFDIPENGIKKEQVRTRIKNNNILIEMEIQANDSTYTCRTSHISYNRWFKEKIHY